ncbi:squamous cell carcinoma antigen recognized by T-cells 3-like [Limulus polyphemus]|uniref:Squamous cell carcinoma antigen recognized by T-cells 3-like n=1 Tax=Limulus polyphemus TaxID=6850 RepID=A0ABM1BKL0_LIMPO|nr:squamous cell carcinoma antigen recognized by T-cells 3-like [Limulus polyphemus]
MAENTENYESDPDSSNSAEDRSDDEEVDQNDINRLNSEANDVGKGRSEDKYKGLKKAFKEKVYNLIVSVVLLRINRGDEIINMEKTYEEYKEWVEGEVEPQVYQAYKKAKTKLEKLVPLEEELEIGNKIYLKLLLSYREILKAYDRHHKPKNYTKYLDTQLKIPSISLSTHERAIRNCPWSVILWINYIQALERYQQPYDKVKETVDRALQAGFTQEEEFRQLWLTFLDYLRRRIDWNGENTKELSELRETFERVIDHMTQSFGADADPGCIILQYWAKIEAKFCKNMTRARELWNNIINQGRGSEVRIWLEYANLERAYGDDKHYRRVLLRGLHSATDWPETIGEILINFEREEGTLESLDSSIEKYDAQIKRLQEKRQKIEEKEAERQYQASERKKQAKAEKKVASKKPIDAVAHKQQKPEYHVEAMDVDKEGFKVPPPPSSKNQKTQPFISAPPPGFKKNQLNLQQRNFEMEQSESEQSVKHDHSKDDRTVFLSNLAYSVAEENIKEVFSELGEITEIRLVKDYRGRSKGYCYLEFASQEAARAALKRDRQPVEGRPVFISKCEDKSMSLNKNKFKFPVQMEKHKLFIRGLPLSITEHKLKDIFKEVSAATALVKTDGMKVDDQTISVAISNPPERKSLRRAGDGEGSENRIIASLGGGRETGPRGRGRTQVSLLPRALQRTQPGTSRSNDFQNGVNGAGEDVNTTEKQMTNNDFRNMLLKK